MFQVGALPLVVLGPLGAVSLLYNAFFARLILGDQFSVQLVAGEYLRLALSGADVLGAYTSSGMAAVGGNRDNPHRSRRRSDWHLWRYALPFTHCPSAL